MCLAPRGRHGSVHQAEDHRCDGGGADGGGLGHPGPRVKENGGAKGEGRAKRYLRPSIHSVSACEPRPRAASIAALYPRIACSLDMTSLVRGFSSRSARKPATASENLPIST